ncbi:MAG: uroporphyrinogen-III C-methyltransferase, partial [Dehalococcoidia bacterium]|nr:uroporphyrinogen-III C-methyltransferase [Dehalococcoidia bacterium]
MVCKLPGIVYLIGAGPGDPGLLTVKGLRFLRKAEVVVYDRLVDRRILGRAGMGAELGYVGKGPGQRAMEQEELNRYIVERALEGKVGARLKGGDPFVFGRGGEEAQALALAGVPFEVVPGVTSAVAAPAYAGIPLTHWDMASSFTEVSGREDPNKDEPSVQWGALARSGGTLVVLM